MPDLPLSYEAIHVKMVDTLNDADFSSKDTTTLLANLKQFREIAPIGNQPEHAPIPVPVTKWEKFKAGASGVWDNETTRVGLKVLGSLASVGAVTWATIHKDHVIEKQALAQANTRLI